ncbi:TetR/AcrR family transcriptional regulator [Sinosporangium siamense]|uniref:TetR family transcriptional regulator n=1 Tax=Sinosporangium siamense TaxID=1367973 RepID=A0A919VA46_9ACTN|nr:TetR/AcrR family transcriptional regulator [Sinosporangium siamense]GII96046.1 TetR family transcriptional regulator [Sinosporangium siamense]
MATHENLWLRSERQGTRGPKPSFSREALTEAAIRIADAEGIEAISMRRLALELGAGTMSLYRYVSGKDDVIELMIDTAVDGYIPEGTVMSGDWVTDMRDLAQRSRQTMLRHPWLAPLAANRQQTGPNRFRLMEETLAIFDGLGLSPDRMLTVVGSVIAYVNGFVQSELAYAEAMRRTGLDMRQWMALHTPFIESMLATGRFPRFARMTAEAGRELVGSDARFLYGLDRLLDGLKSDMPPRPPA